MLTGRSHGWNHKQAPASRGSAPRRQNQTERRGERCNEEVRPERAARGGGGRRACRGPGRARGEGGSPPEGSRRPNPWTSELNGS